jgi:hypothetical protein
MVLDHTPDLPSQWAAILAWPTAYRDADWIKATWLGNDWITLLVEAPMMWGGRRAAGTGSVRGEFVSLGTVDYAAW